MRASRYLNGLKVTRKLLIWGVCLYWLTAMSAVAANNTITFTWEAATISVKNFGISATLGETFTVSWGDGATDIETGTSLGQYIYHSYASTGTYDVIITGSTDCVFTYFYCIGSLLTALDVSASTELMSLYCASNQLTTLDLSANTELRELYCAINRLSVLDVSTNTKLIILACGFNQLTALNVNANTQLIELDCHDNQLSVLNVSTNTKLIELNCSNNRLTALDISENTELIKLWCYENQLITLDLSKNTELEWLQCQDNQLSDLNVNDYMRLTMLYCFNNRFLLSKLFTISERVINQNLKYLSPQNLLPLIVSVGQELFSSESVFNGIYTNYEVSKNSNPASESDYTIVSGKIIFNTLGHYTVIMSNSAIVSSELESAKVITEISVINEVGIETIETSKINIYPNPAKDNFLIECESFSTIKLYDMLGKEVLTQTANGKTEINIIHLLKGIYNVRVFSEGKVIENRKIVKY